MEISKIATNKRKPLPEISLGFLSYLHLKHPWWPFSAPEVNDSIHADFSEPSAAN